MLAAMSAMALLAGPAAAHVNDAIPDNKGAEQAQERQGGTPFAGFIGPEKEFIGDDVYFTAHGGMECGAQSSPQIGELADVFGFVCPAGDNK